MRQKCQGGVIMGIEIGKLSRLTLGYQGENNARPINVDVSDWLKEFPGAAVGLMLMRPGEDEFYPAAVKVKDGVMSFIPTRGDLVYAGEGEAQFILTGTDDVELRSRVVKTTINASLLGTLGEAPPPETAFIQQVVDAADRAERAAEEAEKHKLDVVGIERVYQKVTSLDDGGENIIYVVLTNGTMSRFSVRNGRQGRPGAEADYGADNAGMLLLVGDDGKARPIALGAGLQIVDGTLTVTGAPSDDAQHIFYTSDGSVFHTVDDAIFYVKGD